MENIKELDVFRFIYKPLDNSKSYDMRSHCFDGQLIARKNSDGQLILKDTYWSSGDGVKFTLEEAQEKGTLTFICNLNDVTEIKEHEQCYYADDDIFNLSYQHNCYRRFMVKKSAVRNREKMLKVLYSQLAEQKSKIESSIRTIENISVNISKVESNNLDIWI